MIWCCEPHVRAQRGRAVGTDRPMSATLPQVFKETLVLPVMIPTMSDFIEFQIFDWDVVGRDLIATLWFQFKELDAERKDPSLKRCGLSVELSASPPCRLPSIFSSETCRRAFYASSPPQSAVSVGSALPNAAARVAAASRLPSGTISTDRRKRRSAADCREG